MNQKMKLIFKIGLPIFLLFIIGFIYYNLTNSTELNYFVASNIYMAPANTTFTDDNFYKCVVDAYNLQNHPDVAYTDSLTDEQLQMITHLSCSGFEKTEDEKITSVNGLEKLTELRELNLSYNNLIELDLSHNTKLTDLDVEVNDLTELDVSNNIKLTDLDVNSNDLTKLDVSKNIKLIYLNVGFTNLTELDLSHNTLLKFLYVLRNNNLIELDISQNKELITLNLDHNNFKFITLFNEWNVSDFISILDSSTYKVENQTNEEVTDGFVGSGYKLKTDSNKSVIVIRGDITGDGKIRMSDVMKTANQILNENTITEDYYLKAADITGDNQIRMSDVMKLANAVLEGGVLK